jgi:hypothetical protein
MANAGHGGMQMCRFVFSLVQSLSRIAWYISQTRFSHGSNQSNERFTHTILPFSQAQEFLGTENVHEHVGREPSGGLFNMLRLSAPNADRKCLPTISAWNKASAFGAELLLPVNG